MEPIICYLKMPAQNGLLASPWAVSERHVAVQGPNISSSRTLAALVVPAEATGSSGYLGPKGPYQDPESIENNGIDGFLYRLRAAM